MHPKWQPASGRATLVETLRVAQLKSLMLKRETTWYLEQGFGPVTPPGRKWWGWGGHKADASSTEPMSPSTPFYSISKLFLIICPVFWIYTAWYYSTVLSRCWIRRITFQRPIKPQYCFCFAFKQQNFLSSLTVSKIQLFPLDPAARLEIFLLSQKPAGVLLCLANIFFFF